jgi:hypothetical protein
MAGISEVIQTIGAIIIFSLILLTSNRMILKNSTQEVETEAEGIAITLGQNIIKEAQTKAFDENTTDQNVPTTVPDGFSGIDSDGENRNNYDDFDDYDGYTATMDTKLGAQSFAVAVKVAYVSPSNNYDIEKGSETVPTNFKMMQVTITSDYLDNNREIKLSHLRRYFKTKEQ